MKLFRVKNVLTLVSMIFCSNLLVSCATSPDSAYERTAPLRDSVVRHYIINLAGGLGNELPKTINFCQKDDQTCFQYYDGHIFDMTYQLFSLPHTLECVTEEGKWDDKACPSTKPEGREALLAEAVKICGDAKKIRLINCISTLERQKEACEKLKLWHANARMFVSEADSDQSPDALVEPDTNA